MYRNGKGVFGKNRNYLFKALEKFECDKLIWCDKVSHTVRRYKITLNNDKILDLLAKSSLEMDKAFESNLRVIEGMARKDVASPFFEFVLYSELANFLCAIKNWLIVEDEWKEVIRDSVLKYNVENFADIISACGRSNPDALENAMKNVIEVLNNKRDKNENASGIGTKDISLEK